jgi:hypothetical protein
MESVKLYSKNKKELNEKVVALIDDKQLDLKYRVTLKAWHKWFTMIYENLELPTLETNEFFRAYYSHPHYYAIQIWRTHPVNKQIRQYVYTLYSNQLDVSFYESKTKIINDKEDIKKAVSESLH